jgi:hypothetical protein
LFTIWLKSVTGKATGNAITPLDKAQNENFLKKQRAMVENHACLRVKGHLFLQKGGIRYRGEFIPKLNPAMPVG